MDSAQAKILVHDTFTHAFDKARYQRFVHEVVNHYDDSKAGAWNHQYIKDAFKPHVERYERLGTYTAPGREKVDLLIVYLTRDTKLQRARTALRNFVAYHLKQHSEKDAALAAFVSPTERTWRFSFVKMEYAAQQGASGKVSVTENLTPAKRYSYLVGEGESCHTAQSRFVDILQETVSDPTMEQLEDAFSVETVTKEFFSRYLTLFERINLQLQRLLDTNSGIRKEFESKSINPIDFSKKLLGQIVFLYFIQKKGWLGGAKDDLWGTGPRDFLRRLNRGEYGAYKNFFNDVLEPLFYETLATDRGHEAWCKRFGCRIPFLNGGLFEPLADYDWKKTDIALPNEIFANRETTREGDLGTGILDVFDRYNFTVNEAEPLEQEVAIDPEMLGKVFENLIEENRRKGMGAFYTPREIVHYMCQESLVRFLYSAVNPEAEPIVQRPIIQDGLFASAGPVQDTISAPPIRERISRDDLEAFIHSGEQAAHYEAARLTGTVSYRPQLPSSIEDYARLIDEKLRDIAVCDPAIGSGAFPVGMMTEIVRARMTLTPYFSDVRDVRGRSPYQFKRHAIQNCLYGADIDRGAVEIAKLRLWLSLVVDEEETKQIKPLPNLDFKIVAGNSLLGFPERYTSPSLSEIEQLKNQYFEEPDHDRKAALKARIDGRIREVLARSAGPLGYPVNFDFQLFFSEVFRERNGRGSGFDIVIGNPPYVRADGDDEHMLARRQIQQTGLYETLWEKWDLYIPFIERGYKLLRNGGVITFIVSDAFCHAKYAEKPQDWFLKHARVLRLDFFSKIKIFEAAVRNVTFFFQKGDGLLNVPERRVHDPAFGQLKILPSDQQQRLNHRAFFPEDTEASVFSKPTVLLESICYISKGMVVHADEKVAKGQFELDDLVSETKDKTHSRAFVEGKYLARWLPTTHKWLEWGTSRAPRLFSRPTFSELYTAKEKLISVDMAAGTQKLRVIYDATQLYHNHSAWSFVPWCNLAGVHNNSLKKAARYKDESTRPDLPMREDLEATSRRFDVKYLLAVMNSSTARDFLRANRRSNIHLYPEDWKQLPIPEATHEQQATVAALVDKTLVALQSDPKADVSALEEKIDDRVALLYGVPQETAVRV